MGKALVNLPDAFEKRRSVSLFDDFLWFVTAHQWTSVLTDSGTASVGDAKNGVLALVASDGTVADNDEAYVKSTQEVFLIAADKPILAEARVQFSEANTDDANVFFGIMDAIGANTLVDDGGGLKASFSGAAIYKVDGGTVWKCVSSLAGVQTVSTSTKAAGGTAYQTLRIEISPVSSTVAEVTFWVDGLPLYDAAILGRQVQIKHLVTYTGATEMTVGAGVKNGGANLETLNVDYIGAFQVRG
jgi:hypothetical protein